MSATKKIVFALIVACTYLSGGARQIMTNAAQAAEGGGMSSSSGGSCG